MAWELGTPVVLDEGGIDTVDEALEAALYH